MTLTKRLLVFLLCVFTAFTVGCQRIVRQAPNTIEPESNSDTVSATPPRNRRRNRDNNRERDQTQPPPTQNAQQIPTVGVRRLPFTDPERLTEVNRTLDLIESNGPFPYPQDGSTFGNYEQRLPEHPRGYYREYTVRTPGLRHRGARRIVQGQNVETYYTDDHYQSFTTIDPRRY